MYRDQSASSKVEKENCKECTSALTPAQNNRIDDVSHTSIALQGKETYSSTNRIQFQQYYAHS